MDYEYRFYQAEEFRALHMASLETDTDAMTRARLYLKSNPEFSHVEVRRGRRFMLRIANDWLPGESAPLS